MAMIQWN